MLLGILRPSPSPLYAAARCAPALLLTALALAGGCGTRSAALTADAAQPAGRPGWPPAVASPPRQVSDWGAYFYGRDTSDRSPNCSAAGTTLTMPAGLSWAVYCAAGAPVRTISVDFTELPDGASAHLAVGVANYTRGAWEWHDGGNGSFALALDQPEDYYSPQHRTYVALAVDGAGEAIVADVLFEQSGATALSILEDPPELAPAHTLRFIGSAETPAWECDVTYFVPSSYMMTLFTIYDIDGDTADYSHFDMDRWGPTILTPGVHTATIDFDAAGIQNFTWTPGAQVYPVLKVLGPGQTAYAGCTAPLTLTAGDSQPPADWITAINQPLVQTPGVTIEFTGSDTRPEWTLEASFEISATAELPLRVSFDLACSAGDIATRLDNDFDAGWFTEPGLYSRYIVFTPPDIHGWTWQDGSWTLMAVRASGVTGWQADRYEIPLVLEAPPAPPPGWIIPVEDPLAMAPGMNIEWTGSYPESPSWELDATYILSDELAYPCQIFFDFDVDPLDPSVNFTNDAGPYNKGAAGQFTDHLVFTAYDIGDYVWHDGDYVFLGIRTLNIEGITYAVYRIPLFLNVPYY